MISEEKMTHIVHLMLDGLEKRELVSFTKKDEAVREAKKVCFAYLGRLAQVDERVRQRIQSQKNAPVEHSRQWDTLYEKYFEEEVRKLGG